MIARFPEGISPRKSPPNFWREPFFDLSLQRYTLFAGDSPFLRRFTLCDLFQASFIGPARLQLSEFRSLPTVCGDSPCPDATACGREFSKCRFLKFCAYEKSTIARAHLAARCASTGRSPLFHPRPAPRTCCGVAAECCPGLRRRGARIRPWKVPGRSRGRSAGLCLECGSRTPRGVLPPERFDLRGIPGFSGCRPGCPFG